MENLDTEMHLKLEKLIDKNMVSLNLEQDERSKALHQMSLFSTGMVLGRADIDQKCCMVEEKSGWWRRRCGTAKQQLSCSTRVVPWLLCFNWRTSPAQSLRQ